MNRIPRILTAAASVTALAPALAVAQFRLPDDHVDFGIGYDAGSLALHWHDEGGATEYAPDEAYAHIPLSSSAVRPAGAQWDFTGVIAGATIYLAPATQTSGVIFLGLGSEEILDGTFAGDSVTLTLDSVSGPGHFALWQTDGFGTPLVALSSFAGTSSVGITTGGHDHYNWGFTAPGVYALTFTVTGTLAGESSPISDTGTFTFAVGAPIPEPSSFAAVAGLCALGLSAARRRHGSRRQARSA